MFKIILFTVLIVHLLKGQDDVLENECNILHDLESNQTRLTSAETLISQLITDVAALNESLIIAKAEIANLKLKLKGSSSIACPDSWSAFQGSCYLSYNGTYNFQNAQAKCQTLGGRLVHIEDATEQAFIENFLGKSQGTNHWIGLTDELVEGVWKWTGTDTVANYTNWASGEPGEGTGSNCCGISAVNGHWYDVPWHLKFKPLCER